VSLSRALQASSGDLPPADPKFSKWWSLEESGAIIAVDSESNGSSPHFWNGGNHSEEDDNYEVDNTPGLVYV
jgi:hypothetical protein